MAQEYAGGATPDVTSNPTSIFAEEFPMNEFQGPEPLEGVDKGEDVTYFVVTSPARLIGGEVVQAEGIISYSEGEWHELVASAKDNAPVFGAAEVWVRFRVRPEDQLF
jgi:hypothetical protein